MAYDLFPMEVLDNRKRYYARAIPEKVAHHVYP